MSHTLLYKRKVFDKRSSRSPPCRRTGKGFCSICIHFVHLDMEFSFLIWEIDPVFSASTLFWGISCERIGDHRRETDGGCKQWKVTDTYFVDNINIICFYDSIEEFPVMCLFFPYIIFPTISLDNLYLPQLSVSKQNLKKHKNLFPAFPI